MARPLRLSFENAVYHITARGNRRDNIFYSDKDKKVFIEKMNETFEKYSFICFAYCLMDNHYHLFIKTPLANIKKGMHYLNTSYSNWFKARHKIVGVIFQGRYKSILVDENNYGIGLSAYIHLNPVRAGIVSNIKEYKWSSFLDYTGKRRSVQRLDIEFVLRQFDDDLSKAKNRYDRFVVNNTNINNPLEESYKGIALGNKAFIERIKERIESFGRMREVTETRIAETHTVEKIINKITDNFEIGRNEIFRRGKGNIYRKMALYLIKKYSNLSLKEIGELFNMDYSAVSQSHKRFEGTIQKNRSILNMVKTVEKDFLKRSNVNC